MKNNWPVKKLGELIVLNYGKGIPESDRKTDGLYLIYGANGELGRTDKYLVEGKAIIIGRKGSAGEVTRVSGKFWPSDVTYYAFGNKGVEIDFLFYLFKNINLKRFAKGIKPGINRNDVYNLEIPVPGIEEQRRIVKKLEKILAKIEEAHVLRQESIEEARKIVNTSVKKTLSGINNLTELGVLCNVTKLAGFEFTKHVKYQDDGEIIALRGLNIKNRTLNLTKVKYISKDTSNFLKRSKLEKDDLVMSYAGTLGSVAIVPDSDKFHCAPNVSKISIKNKKVLLPQFLLWCLDSSVTLEQINYLSKIAAQPSISMSNIRKIKIPAPDVKEQGKIVAYLDGLSEKVQTLQKLQQEQLQDLEALQQSVLHKAFQGEL